MFIQIFEALFRMINTKMIYHKHIFDIEEDAGKR